ncbi:ras-GEF domain-containing family member 1B-like [Anopheles aquasalis]|uniref:ras-GEF domain-containing family member 1B-like n=1 Tax=Anopheles aquasalis TaxID=42839 RepID=UPI00215B2BC9|nr:ras-GEF domain-containing family member 1B-like [Anopheles aquasalis]XP_050082332.1 ras-GEF domain-containing family member 1B-like [Anopheles aquasalis]
MAMYYYASKLSAVACGTRCRQGLARRQRSNRTNTTTNQQHQQTGSAATAAAGKKTDDDEESDDNNKDKKTLSSFFSEAANDTIVISVKSSEQPEVCCESTPLILTHEGSLGTGGVMYGNGTIVSGPLESLIDLLMPSSVEEFDQEYVFSFLLSARFFIRSYELLGKLLDSIPGPPEPLERIVPLLGVWTKMFPYDFRDERMMNHVKHIVARCADTELASVVSQLLCALLARLTQLENHEEELKSYQSIVDNKTESITWPTTAAQLAQLLCRIERRLAKHVGPEEFVQCSPNLLKDPNREDFTPKLASALSSGGAGAGNATGGLSLDAKKTCNLESYLEWSARLRLLVANEILKCQNIQDRNKQFELWSGAAQYCLLVGNYNSATAILESFDLPPVARLQITWSKLSSTTSQQLDCMQRHAEGCGNLWSKQTELHNHHHQQQHHHHHHHQQSSLNGNGTAEKRRNTLSAASSSGSGSSKASAPGSTVQRSNEWVVIPVFVDIIKLALKAREDCCVRLPNGHINMTAFDRLAAIVGAFTRHMNQVNQTLPDVGEYAMLCRFMQSCKLLNETELMLASFECEAPTSAEKELYDVA